MPMSSLRPALLLAASLAASACAFASVAQAQAPRSLKWDELVPAAPPKPLKPGPVAVFISRKEGKLFVRKGFEPVFDVPVKIANPEVPLGTHVYTASESRADSLAFNWMVVSLPGEGRVAPASEKRGKREKQAATPPVQSVGTATATEALDRVEIPTEAADRLAEMLGPGASLIISDKGLGYQTGKGTDFIVLSR